ncbi:PAS domain S-box protein [Desulfobacula toluolica]|nr:PAS domain S-box protein [Desulfobacula toluolica]
MKQDKWVTQNRMFKRGTGLFDKILILHLFSTTVLFLIIIISYYFIEKNDSDNSLLKKSILIHDLLEISCIDPVVSTIAYDRINPAIETLYKKNQEIVYIEIYDDTANIIACVGNIPAHHLDIEKIVHLSRNQNLSKLQINKNFYELITHLNIKDRHIGLIRIGVTKEYLQTQLEKNILYFLGSFIIAIALTSLVFYCFTNKWIVMPIIKVSNIMKNYGHDALPTLFDNIKKYNNSITKDEIGVMSIAFERMISSIIDRTREKEKAEKRYRLIAENVSDVIWTMDMNLVFTYISPSIQQQNGYTVEEAMKMPIKDIMPPDSFKKATKLHQKKLKSIESGDPDGWESTIFEIEQYRKDGTTIWTSINIKFLPDLHLQPASILGITRNITDQKRAESALAKSERNYREIFNATSDALFILDNEKNRFFDVNMSGLTMFGYEKQELLKCTATDISSGIPPYDQKGIDEKTKKAVEEGSHIFEWQAKKKNGDIFWTEINLKFSKIGNKERMLSVVRDINERKKTREMIVQSEKMLSVGGLAAGMAHEINNPLAGMMQTADVMSKRLTNIEIPANMRAAEEIGINMNDIKAFMKKRGILRMIKTINESGARMATIVNNMLSFARKSDTLVSSYSLSELIDRTLELAATEFDLKKHYDFKMIEIKKEYDDTVPPVPCERAKIQQVLLNILRNGAQAMQENQTPNPLFIVQTHFEKKRKMVSMTIQDNGPGMDEKTRKRVFEPFYTTKPVGIGTGLGLSVSYFIITENHAGEMSVESTPGSGAKFIIRLPI